MTFKDYFNLTKETTLSCLKICSIIFASIYIIAALVIGNLSETLIEAIKIFSIIFSSGIALACLVWSLAITSAYKEAKRVTKFYNNIPDKIKKQFGLKLVEKPLNPKFNYLKFEFVNSNNEETVLFNFSRELIWITLLIDLSDVDNLSGLIVDINSTYKKDNIELTAWGIRQKIKWKDWDSITNEKIIAILERLTKISTKQNLKIITKDLKDTEIQELVSG